jgi:phosphonopyruvate decarboxylase
MIEAADFLGETQARSFDFWTGVPCSFLTPFINYVGANSSIDYVGAANEGDAIAIAAGAQMAGRRCAVMFQNSGLGNAINPLTSLTRPFQIPMLLIITHRGAPDLRDEPQHEQMGAITESLLDTLDIEWEIFPSERAEISSVLDRAVARMDRRGLPVALVMKKGSVAPFESKPSVVRPRTANPEVEGVFAAAAESRMSRVSAVSAVRTAVAGERPIVATTGKMGRELFALGHNPNQFYMVGSMGCAASVGLGLSRGGGGAGAVVLDGDGSLLMRMGSMATVGHYAPPDLIHVLCDNEAHESTGAQATVSPGVDFATIAAACGYTNVTRVDTETDLVNAFENALDSRGPHFIHVKVAIGSAAGLPRPDRSPQEYKGDLMSWLAR